MFRQIRRSVAFSLLVAWFSLWGVCLLENARLIPDNTPEQTDHAIEQVVSTKVDPADRLLGNFAKALASFEFTPPPVPDVLNTVLPTDLNQTISQYPLPLTSGTLFQRFCVYRI